MVKKVPAVRSKIEKEKQAIRDSLEKKLQVDKYPKFSSLPKTGVSQTEVLKMMNEMQEEDRKHWDTGKISGSVYVKNMKHIEFLNKAYSMYSLSNLLHPDLFKSVRKYELEVIRMASEMMQGDSSVCGIITSGGTESILMACKAYRDRYNKKNPEMIAPVTAHAAFDKAASYFGIKLVHVPVDPVTQQARVSDVKRAINKNTICIIGSAPQFPHGVIDPILEMAALAQSWGIGFHTDSCLGGFFLPFIRMMQDAKVTSSGQTSTSLDFGITPFDFSVPGVTSISMDTHKYGLTPKGSSILLFRNEDWRRSMYFSITDWPGGVYASPAIAGSRAGGVIATCWASMISIGNEGFKSLSLDIWKTAQSIKKQIKQDIPELELVGDSYSSIVSFTAKKSTKIDIFKVNDAMTQKGWHLNALQKPSAIHICVTNQSAGMEDVFIFDLKKSVREVIEKPDGFPDGTAPIYGMTASLPDRSIISEITYTYLDGMLSPKI